MELGSLSKYIHDDLSDDYRAKVALDVAKGMSFLHNCGLMHRDLKPQNILVVSLVPSQQVVVKIADFGVSKEMPVAPKPKEAPLSPSTSAKLSQSKRLTGGVGTPIYMAPEVLEGEKYTTSADVYSFAMLLLELYSGQEPYDSDKFRTPWQIAQFVTAGNRLEIPDSVPKEITGLITKCWDNDPSARPNFDYCVEILGSFCTFASSSKAGSTKPKKHHREVSSSHHHHKDKKEKKDKKKKKKKAKEESEDEIEPEEAPSEKKKKKKKAVEESAPAQQTSDTSSSSSSSVAF